jgi:hypothetical protein
MTGIEAESANAFVKSCALDTKGLRGGGYIPVRILQGLEDAAALGIIARFFETGVYTGFRLNPDFHGDGFNRD